MINSFETYAELIKEVEFAKANNPKYALYGADHNWYNEAPSLSGVYLIWHDKTLVYVGETSNIKKRMRDIQDTRNHTLRRKVGRMHFSNEQGFLSPISSKKFTPEIEDKITHYMKKNFKITYIPLMIGRKEIEEYFLHLNPLYNTPSKRRRNTKVTQPSSSKK
ncbi:GIY-YIG nuclease family protein [Bacillaceae bacterium S4-13-58]